MQGEVIENTLDHDLIMMLYNDHTQNILENILIMILNMNYENNIQNNTIQNKNKKRCWIYLLIIR